MLLLVLTATSICPYAKHARKLEISAAEHAAAVTAFLSGTAVPAVDHPYGTGAEMNSEEGNSEGQFSG